MKINKFMTILMVICATHEMHARVTQTSKNSTARTTSTQPTATKQTQAQTMRKEIDTRRAEVSKAEALKSSKTTIAKTNAEVALNKAKAEIVAKNKTNATKTNQWNNEISEIKKTSSASQKPTTNQSLTLDQPAQPQTFAGKQQMVQKSLLLEPGKPKPADKAISQKPVTEKPQEKFENRKSIEIKKDSVVRELNEFNKLTDPSAQSNKAYPAPTNKVTYEPVAKPENQSSNSNPVKVKKTLPEKIKEYQDTLVAEYKAIKKKIAELSSDVATGLKPKKKVAEKEPQAKTVDDKASTPQDGFWTKIQKSSQQSAQGFGTEKGFEQLKRETTNKAQNPDAIRVETKFENGTHTIKNTFKDTSQGAQKNDLFTKEKTFSKDGVVETKTKKEGTNNQGDVFSKTIKTETLQPDGYKTKTSFSETNGTVTSERFLNNKGTGVKLEPVYGKGGEINLTTITKNKLENKSSTRDLSRESQLDPLLKEINTRTNQQSSSPTRQADLTQKINNLTSTGIKAEAPSNVQPIKLNDISGNVGYDAPLQY